MASLSFNSKNIRRVPINRNSLFYDAQSYELELSLGREAMENDMGQTVVLYRVDVASTNVDSVYGETKANGIVFKTPVEVPCVYKIEDPQFKAYNQEKQLGTYLKSGKLTVSVYQETLDELGVDVKKGDYIGVQVTPTHMEYYVVDNENTKNYDNRHSLWGIKPLWRTITCSHVDKSEFNG